MCIFQLNLIVTEKFHEDQRPNNKEEVLTESDSEEDDLANESLEPSFKKEDLNRSRLLQRSILDTTKHDNKIERKHDITIDSENNDSVVETLEDTLKDVDGSRNLTIGNHNETYPEFTDTSKPNETLDASEVTVDSDNNASLRQTLDKSDPKVRGTYFVLNSMMNNTSNNDSSIKESDSDTINITIDSNKSNASEVDEPQTVKKNRKSDLRNISSHQLEQLDMAGNLSDHKVSHANNVSLAQFEQLEKAANTEHRRATNANDLSLDQFEQLEMASNISDVSLAQFEKLETASISKNELIIKDTTELLSNIKISKLNRNSFDEKKDDDLVPVKDKLYFDIEVNIDNRLEVTKKILLDDRSPSIVKEDISNYEPSTIKKLLGESFTRSDIISSAHHNEVAAKPKKQLSVDIFEGFDSPNILKPTDTPVKVSCNSDIKLFNKTTEKRKFFYSMLNETTKASGSHVSTEKLDDIKESIPNGTQTTDDVFVNPKVIGTLDDKAQKKNKEHLSILDTCIEKVDKEIEDARKSIEQMALDGTNTKSKIESSISDTNKNKSNINLNETENIHTREQNNTIDEFENLYKDITAPRATEFDLLVSQNSTMLNETEATEETEKLKYNLRNKRNTSQDVKEVKDKSVDNKKKTETEEILLESRTCESKAKPSKRNLRLRKRKNQKDSTDQEEDKTANDYPKFKDIINLQKEFSDVTIDVPAPKKETNDIQSPEKKEEGENLPPLGIQSCPSKMYVNTDNYQFN